MGYIYFERNAIILMEVNLIALAQQRLAGCDSTAGDNCFNLSVLALLNSAKQTSFGGFNRVNPCGPAVA
jgi:hypothetical protein